ncbi:MAG TPA: hydantoinase/oxoprolinase family protein [Gemmatimonadales bacterium]|nr:hydantoinase/oxoprolinase family protein [Gemmatimonadales bacterium]
MKEQAVIGWDVGGAHLKGARLSREGVVTRVVQVPCPLWKGMPHLAQAITEVLAAIGDGSVHAVTMTGEMADLFPSRSTGVRQLVSALQERLAHSGAEVRFYAGRSGFVNCEEAARVPMALASANWLAAGAFVAERLSSALLVDIGSTTTDLIPIVEGQVRARGCDDAGRLAAGELVYTGVVRTPVMAMAERVPFAGDWVPVVAEYFATAADVHRLTGVLPEGADQHAAADAGPKDLVGSARRLARMTGRDVESAPAEVWRSLAEWLSGTQLQRIQSAAEDLLAKVGMPADAPVVGAGVGRFLAMQLAARIRRREIEFGSLVDVAGEDPARVTDLAPAVAVAWLAARGG